MDFFKKPKIWFRMRNLGEWILERGSVSLHGRTLRHVALIRILPWGAVEVRGFLCLTSGALADMSEKVCLSRI